MTIEKKYFQYSLLKLRSIAFMVFVACFYGGSIVAIKQSPARITAPTSFCKFLAVRFVVLKQMKNHPYLTATAVVGLTGLTGYGLHKMGYIHSTGSNLPISQAEEKLNDLPTTDLNLPISQVKEKLNGLPKGWLSFEYIDE